MATEGTGHAGTRWSLPVGGGRWWNAREAHHEGISGGVDYRGGISGYIILDPYIPV